MTAKILFKTIYLPTVRNGTKLKLSNNKHTFYLDDEYGIIENLISQFNGDKNFDEICSSTNLDKTLVSEILDFLISNEFIEFINDSDFYRHLSNSRYKSNLLYYSNYSNPILSIMDIHNEIGNKCVLLLGLGGASNIAAILAGMGIGKIVIVDFDNIDSGNLSRQFLFSEKDIGNQKIKVTKAMINNINSDVDVVAINKKISSIASIEEIIQAHNIDFIINGIDNPNLISTRWVNNISVKHSVPFIQGGVSRNQLLVECFYPNKACYDCFIQNNLDISDEFKHELLTNYGRESSLQNVSFAPYISLIAGYISHYIFEYFLNNLIDSTKDRKSFTNIISTNSIDETYKTYHLKNDKCKTCSSQSSKLLDNLIEFF